MAVLIPSLGSCAHRMTSGERRLADRLEKKLDADYLLWYDVPVGPKQSRPDFVVLHPRRGILVLETKDWRLETIQRASREAWTIVPEGRPKVVINPIAQARHCAIQVVNALERDQPLIHASGPHAGKLAFRRQPAPPEHVSARPQRQRVHSLRDRSDRAQAFTTLAPGFFDGC